jgi:hypothetical protein
VTGSDGAKESEREQKVRLRAAAPQGLGLDCGMSANFEAAEQLKARAVV